MLNILKVGDPPSLELDAETVERMKQANGELIEFQMVICSDKPEGKMTFTTWRGRWDEKDQRPYYNLAESE